MKHPKNPFKAALTEKRPLIGLWQGLASPYCADLCGRLGYDWLLIDGEHAPNTIPSILGQLQALAAHSSAPVVRPSWNDPIQLKQLLDIGVQNFMIPMIQSAEDARAAVRALRYPPHGNRGVGTALARAAGWGMTSDYLDRADEEMCLLCQVETAQAIDSLDAIVGTEGVDGVFIGPSDLSASMGHLGHSDHPDVQAVIKDAIQRIHEGGKAAGILQTNPAQARHYIDLGVEFIAVGIDTVLLRKAGADLLAQFR